MCQPVRIKLFQHWANPLAALTRLRAVSWCRHRQWPARQGARFSARQEGQQMRGGGTCRGVGAGSCQKENSAPFWNLANWSNIEGIVGAILFRIRTPMLKDLKPFSSSPRAVCTGGLDPRDLKTALFCISFLRKGEVLAYVGRIHNPKELKGLFKTPQQSHPLSPVHDPLHWRAKRDPKASMLSLQSFLRKGVSLSYVGRLKT